MALFLVFLPGLLVVALLTLAERRRGGAQTDDWRNIQAWLVMLAVAFTLLNLLPPWRGAALIDGARLPFWAGFAIFFGVRDFGEYLFHRAQHRIPFLWAMHSLHHSDPDMAALTTNRHFWGDQLVKQLTIWSVSLMIISPTPAMFAIYGLLSSWNFLTHSRLPIDLGRWSWVINTPGYHRRHHSRLPEHYDSNFAAVLPIFDVILGSYHRPDGFPPTGLERKPEHLGELIIWPLIWNRPVAVEVEPLPVGVELIR